MDTILSKIKQSYRLQQSAYNSDETFKTLKTEYDSLVAQKASLYTVYQAEKKKVNELSSAKKNIEKYLSWEMRKVKGKEKNELD